MTTSTFTIAFIGAAATVAGCSLLRSTFVADCQTGECDVDVFVGRPAECGIFVKPRYKVESSTRPLWLTWKLHGDDRKLYRFARTGGVDFHGDAEFTDSIAEEEAISAMESDQAKKWYRRFKVKNKNTQSATPVDHPYTITVETRAAEDQPFGSPCTVTVKPIIVNQG